MSLFRTYCRVVLALPAWLTLLCVGGVHAAPPNAGSLLQEVKPAPGLPARGVGALPEEAVRPGMKLDAGVKIAVRRIHISGTRAFTEAELQALVADALGKELTLAGVDDIVRRITRYYRDAGYLLARAYLPAQEIADGVVEIAVLEGRLGKLRIDNNSPLADDRVARRLADLNPGEAVEGAVLERSLLLLGDVPGVEVKSTLRPGVSVGTTDLDVRLTTRAPYAGSLELDNHGNPYTGEWRLGGSFTAANLAGIGDSLALRALVADGMRYGRLAWQLPVNDAGTQAGAAYSDMRYELGKDFADLKAHGTAGVGSLYLLHPVLRSRTTNLNAQLNYDNKRLTDDVDAIASRSIKKIGVWTLGLSGDRADSLGGGGLFQWSLAWSAGQLELDHTNRVLDALGHRTLGSYDKFALYLSRQQRLTDALILSAKVQAQRAGKNLDSSEKMSLGGPQGVRAYPQGEAPADDAWLASLELAWRFAPDLQASLFYDAAAGQLHHHPLAADTTSTRRLAGTGLGFAWQRPGDITVQLGIAWRDGPAPTSAADRSPRAWLQAVKRF